MLLATGGAALGACMSGDDSVACGPDTKLVGSECRPVSTSDAGAGDADAPKDPEAPKFAGVTSASPASKYSLLVTWDAAMPANGTEGPVSYRVYLANAPGTQTFDTPFAVVPNGALSFVAEGLSGNHEYYVVVRAVVEGHEDDNRVEIHATTGADKKAPTFAGAKSAAPAAGGRVQVAWDAATDDLTAPQGIRYAVYRGATSPVDTTAAPIFTTEPGADTATVSVPDASKSYHFVVHALDAAGNADTNTKDVTSATGPDTTAPLFGGCVSAAPGGPGAIEITWNPAVDDTTPADQINYTVYAFNTPGPHTDLTKAAAQKSFKGVLSGSMDGLTGATTYSFLCRATDLSGNQDKNQIERRAAAVDNVRPTFAGIKTATPVDVKSVKLTWLAATDDHSTGDKITYDIYRSSTKGGENYLSPPFYSVAGVTEITVATLPGATWYWVVRARDEAGNQSQNTEELAALQDVSFSVNIQPLFTQNCVLTCHTINNINGFYPTYDPGFAYGHIVSKPACDVNHDTVADPWCPSGAGIPDGGPSHSPGPGGAGGAVLVAPGNPDNSVIIFVLENHIMPPTGNQPPTPAQIQLLRDWITQGAKNN